MIADMTDYYKILGIDQLAANHAIIDCYKKEVVFTSPSKTTFKVKGTCLGTMPKVILTMEAKKLVKDRVWAILVNAMNTQKKKKKKEKEKLPWLHCQQQTNFQMYFQRIYQELLRLERFILKQSWNEVPTLSRCISRVAMSVPQLQCQSQTNFQMYFQRIYQELLRLERFILKQSWNEVPILSLSPCVV